METTICGRCFLPTGPDRSKLCKEGHRLLCCGGKLNHIMGCTQDPMYQLGQKWTAEQEKAILDAFIAKE